MARREGGHAPLLEPTECAALKPLATHLTNAGVRHAILQVRRVEKETRSNILSKVSARYAEVADRDTLEAAAQQSTLETLRHGYYGTREERERQGRGLYGTGASWAQYNGYYPHYRAEEFYKDMLPKATVRLHIITHSVWSVLSRRS